MGLWAGSGCFFAVVAKGREVVVVVVVVAVGVGGSGVEVGDLGLGPVTE